MGFTKLFSEGVEAVFHTIQRLYCDFISLQTINFVLFCMMTGGLAVLHPILFFIFFYCFSCTVDSPGGGGGGSSVTSGFNLFDLQSRSGVGRLGYGSPVILCDICFVVKTLKIKYSDIFSVKCSEINVESGTKWK